MPASNVIFKREFNPVTDTLRDFIDMYMVEAREGNPDRGVGPRDVQNWGAPFNNIKAMAPYLDQPAYKVLSAEFWEGEDSPLRRANRDSAKSTLSNIQSKMRALYEEIERQKVFLSAEDRKVLDEANLANIGDRFKKEITGTQLTKKAAQTEVAETKFAPRVNANMMGEFYLKVAEHIKNNPQDGPALTAFLFNVQVGMRPGEVVALTDSNVYAPRASDEILEAARQTSRGTISKQLEASSSTPFLTGFIGKTKTLLDAPLSKHSQALLATQMQYNQQLLAAFPQLAEKFTSTAGSQVLGNTIFMMQDPKTGKPRPVTTQDITNAVQKIKVPGILEGINPDGTTFLMDYFPKAYYARIMNATLYQKLDVPISIAAQLKGRKVKEGGGGRENLYRKLPTGVYPIEHIQAVNGLADDVLDQVEVQFYRPENSDKPYYGVRVEDHFVPSYITFDAEGNLIPPKENIVPQLVMNKASDAIDAYDPSFRDSVVATIPEGEADVDDIDEIDYDEAYNQSEQGTDRAVKKRVAATTEDGKSRFKDAFNSIYGTIKSAAIPTAIAGYLGYQVKEGMDQAAEAGLPPVVGAGAALGVEAAAEIGKGGPAMALTSEELGGGEPAYKGAYERRGGQTPLTEAEYERRGQVIMDQFARIGEYNARLQELGLPPLTQSQAIRALSASEKEPIPLPARAEIEAQEAQQPTPSLDDQMNALQGITPDIQITYPKSEGIQ